MFRRKAEGLDLAICVRSLDVLVLDEADRLLDMGFEASINTILELLPKQRRTGLFSATQTQEVENLVRAGLRNPVRVSVKEKGVAASSAQKTPSRLENYYMVSAWACFLLSDNDQCSFYGSCTRRINA
nr:ATP-dependent RNA helicase DDX55-like [Aotus nancymaae]